jgi:hypothetical protein
MSSSILIGQSARSASISTVTAAASSHDMTTLSVVKAELGITDTNSDEILSRYISEGSAAVENFCNRVLVVETVKDQFWPQRDPQFQIAIQGVDQVQLSRWPVISVSSVVEDGLTLTVDTDFVVDAARGSLIRLDSNGYPTRWPAVAISATFQAGYATIPADVSAALIRMVSQRWFAKGRDPSLRGETIPGVYSAQYWVSAGAGSSGNLTPDVADLLENYRVPVVA